jgi:hypothetical protein
VYATSEAALPDPIPDYSLIYIDGNATFGSARPLNTTSIIFCTGNVTIATNSNSFFNGLLYVQGTYTQNAPSAINGCIVGNSNMTFSGVGDYSEVNYDPDVLGDLVRRMGQYRFSKGITIE